MRFPRTPLFLAWMGVVLVAAVYQVVRLFLVEEFTRSDYAVMVFVHGSLVAQYVIGWVRSRRDEGDAAAGS